MKAETIAVTRVCFPVLALAAAGMLLATSVAMAEPLVTGDLSVYYDFDDPFTTKVFDQSNNGVYAIDANVHRDVLYYTADTVRGAGAAHFDPFLHFGAPGDPNNFNEWLNLKGPTVKALAPELMPSDGFTLSVWVNLEDYDDLGDPDVDHRHNIWDTQAAGGGDGRNHIQALFQDPNEIWPLPGALRTRLRGQQGVIQNIIPDDEQDNLPFGEQWPENEWFHHAVTYSWDGDPNGTGAGHYAMYYNGQMYADGDSDYNGTMGDWGGAAFIGAAEDYVSNGTIRQLNGLMDEFYLFTRALSVEEIEELYNLGGALLGDVNGDGDVNHADVSPFIDILLNGPYLEAADMNGDDLVNGLDVDPFIAALPAAGGAATAVPEPSTLALLVCAGLPVCCLAAGRRRRRDHHILRRADC